MRMPTLSRWVWFHSWPMTRMCCNVVEQKDALLLEMSGAVEAQRALHTAIRQQQDSHDGVGMVSLHSCMPGYCLSSGVACSKSLACQVTFMWHVCDAEILTLPRMM